MGVVVAITPQVALEVTEVMGVMGVKVMVEEAMGEVIKNTV